MTPLTTDDKVVALLERQNKLLERLAQGTDRQREENHTDLSSLRLILAWWIALAALLYPTISRFLQNPMETVQGLDEIYEKPVKPGMKIAGFEVTSGYGPRQAPTAGASSNHRGVDLATPVGTTLYMPGNGEVQCANQPNGAGIYATIVPSDLPYKFRAMHLQNCKPGQYKSGEIFGTTGNTGTSTGPHLHWEQLRGDRHMHPTEGFLWWALQGRPPKPIAPTVRGGLGELGKLYGAIVQQESGGDPSQINLHSGALGKGQILPENVGPWSQQCLGRRLTPAQLLSDPEAQQKVINCKLKEYWDAAIARGESGYEACRSVAATWYSGQWQLKNSNKPQYSKGHRYPSIAAYTKSVCKGF